MMTRVWAVAVLMSCTGGLASAAPPPVDFPHTAIAIPDAKGIGVEWVTRPSEKDGVATSEEARMRFDVDARGRPWFGDGGRRLLVSPKDDAAVLAGADFKDFLFTAEGARVLCSDQYMGELKERADGKKEKGVPVMDFYGRVRLPHGGCRLFRGGPGDIYVVMHNEKGRDEVSIMRSRNGKLRVTNLFSIDAPIAAVTGEGDETFIGVKNWILEIRGNRKSEDYFETKGPVTGLSYSHKAGLFYSTEKSVGFVSPEFQLVFLESPNPEISLRGDELYIRLGRTLGVIGVTGVHRFHMLRWKDDPPAAAR